MNVSGVPSVVYRQDVLSPASQLSYARPSIATFEGAGAVGGSTSGRQLVRLLGTQFGTVEDNAVSAVSYGPNNKYSAQNCRVVVPHQVWSEVPTSTWAYPGKHKNCTPGHAIPDRYVVVDVALLLQRS